jgi:Ca-activated chloride channel family protein
MSRCTPLVLIVCGSVVLAAQQPSFRADTQLVSIFATVTDSDKRLVPDLEAEDFEILDDGKPQSLAFFNSEVQPITVIVMLDTSASMTLALDRLREAAEQFVIRLLPDDQARLCAFNDKIQFSAQFTHDRDSLARSVRDVDYGNGTRLYDALAASLDELRGMNGRRVVLAFTDGHDTESKTRLRTVINRARAEDVMVYAVGLESRYFDGDRMVRSEPDPLLQRVAIETGGGYFELQRSSDLASTFTRVGRELHSQYALAFTPTSLDGRVHRLAVRVKNPRVTVRARRSYLAAAAGRQD